MADSNTPARNRVHLWVHFMVMMGPSYYTSTTISQVGKDRPFIYPCAGSKYLYDKLLPSHRNYELQSRVPLIF